MTDLTREQLDRLIALEIAAQNLYFGNRADESLWEAMRLAGNFETREELGHKRQEQELKLALKREGPVDESSSG